MVRGDWQICRRSWHGKCYAANKDLVFQIASPENDEGDVWKRKKDEGRFLTARHGDMLCAPFQCDRCWFLNLKGQEPDAKAPSDMLLMDYIRRVNLDVLWSREASTVANTMYGLKKEYRLSKELGMDPIRIKMGPWPVKDTQGFQVAITMVRTSRDRGRNAQSYVQFDSIRKIRSAHSNAFEAGVEGALFTEVFRGEHGKMCELSHAPTESTLSRMVMKGCEKRMGRLVNQDLGLAFDVLMEMLSNYDEELGDCATSSVRKRHIVVCAAYFVVSYAAALRGGEGLLMEASELIRRRLDGRADSKHPHVLVPLMGRFKGETGERNVLLGLASMTNGGLKVRTWVERLIMILIREERGKLAGPAICGADGYVMERWILNGELHSALAKVQSSRPDLISASIQVDEKFSIHRSFRRGATTRAKEVNVGEVTINMNNRWRKVQNKSGSLPNLPMSELYVEMNQALATKLRFSRAL
jgi:hypothetical protein